MASPQVADGGTASNMEGTCEYIEYTVLDGRRWVVVPLGGLARCQQLLTVKTYLATYRSHRKPRTWTDTLGRDRWRALVNAGMNLRIP